MLDLPIYLYNTKTKSLQEFKPIHKGEVRYYSCGPTVYHFAHVGNIFSFNLSDWLRRLFSFWGYKVTQVINITDVGHLTHDADMGQEDRIVKALNRWKKEGKQNATVQDVIDYYTAFFIRDLILQNIKIPNYLPFASHHVKEMQDIIKKLEEKGYAYKTSTAVYYNVPKFKDYNKLYKQALKDKIVQARDDVVVDDTKKHPADFRLWQLDQDNHIMQWDSPWGRGFPGWHIECSAMSMKYLGRTFDIHTGGVDHIPLHHTNEIAQSEACTNQEYANYWLHNQHVKIEGEKMAKSAGNFYTLNDVLQKGYQPWHVRFFYSQHHYRTMVNFEISGLDKAKQTYQKLIEYFQVAKTRFYRSLELLEQENDFKQQEYVRTMTGLFVELKSWANVVKYMKNTDNLQEYLDVLKDRETGYTDIFQKDFDGIASNKTDAEVLTYENVIKLLGELQKHDILTARDVENIHEHVLEIAKTYANDLSGPNLWSVVFRLLKQLYTKHPLYSLVVLAVASYLTGVALMPFILPVEYQVIGKYRDLVNTLSENDLFALALEKSRLEIYKDIDQLSKDITKARRNKDYENADKLKEQALQYKFVNKIVDLPDLSVIILKDE